MASKKATKPAKKVGKKVAEKVESGLSVAVVGVDGKKTGTIMLPKEAFGAKINKPLMAQAVRVHLANIRAGGAATKTRGMVEGSTRKIYKQKGTGRARHGSIRAHIFVGGGVVFGPVPHDFALSMPSKMKKRSTLSALSSKKEEGNIIVVDGFTGLKPKTKLMAEAIHSVAGQASALIVLDTAALSLFRSIRNIYHVDSLPVENLNTYDILAHEKIIFMKDAIKQIKI